MTKEEQTIYEKVPCDYPKWWWPVQWFSSLLMRAYKEGRIKDFRMLDSIFSELLTYRNACAKMVTYDWISIPLVYTQVVTLATYTYSLSLMVGRQYLDQGRGDEKRTVDIYIPIFTLLKFFFAMGWLKVAEQIVNPYGEDDDDFELNWCLDRNTQIVFILLDHFHLKHPKLRKDIFWDDMSPQLPHTRTSARNINPQLGSAFNMKVNPEDAEFLPMDTLIEEDKESNICPNDSIRQRPRTRPRRSIFANLWNSNLGQMIRRRSTGSYMESQGQVNSGFSLENGKFVPIKGSPASQYRKSSLGQMPSPTSNSHPKHTYLDIQEVESDYLPNGSLPEHEIKGFVTAINTSMAPVMKNIESSHPNSRKPSGHNADCLYLQMPTIHEELSRAVSTISMEAIPDTSILSQVDDVQSLVAEASKVLEDLNRVAIAHRHSKDGESKVNESYGSRDSEKSSSDEAEDIQETPFVGKELHENDSIVIDVKRTGCSQIKEDSLKESYKEI